MKRLFLILFLFVSINIVAQNNEISTTMGIDFMSTPSFRDYINQNYTDGEEMSDFNSAVQFTIKYGKFLTPGFMIAGEIGYQIYSYNNFSGLGQYDVSLNHILPSLLAYYVIAGEGYNFKIGGGAGLRLLYFTEKLPGDANATDYTATGFGLILRGEGTTRIDGNLHAHIGGDVRYDLGGKPEPGESSSSSNRSFEEVEFNSLIVGVRLGISYYF
jgi:hypothetical protein